jgi:hypothetical protein
MDTHQLKPAGLAAGSLWQSKGSVMSKATKEAGEELTHLEGAINNASLMAGLLDEAMVHTEEQANRPPAPNSYQLDGEQFERLMFAVSHLRTMVGDVKTKFYALHERLASNA